MTDTVIEMDVKMVPTEMYAKTNTVIDKWPA